MSKSVKPVPRQNLSKSEERFRLLVEGVRDYAIFLLDTDGIVSSWNAGAERIKGYLANEIIGKHFSIFYPGEAIARNWPAYELEQAAEKGRFEDEGWRLRKDGTRFWASVVITAIYDAGGKVQGFSKITRDLTERREHEERLRQSEERFRLLVEGVRDYAIFMLKPDGTVATWNAGAERIKGYQAQDIVGKHFSVFYPPDALARNYPAFELVSAAADGRFEDEGWRVRKNGTLFWANVVISALRSATGELLGFAKLTRDLTQRRRVEALEASERQNSEFLAMLAHELRNPLAPIHNAVSMLGMVTIADPQVSWARDIIERQTIHLTRLVDDLLDISRLTTGKVTLRAQLLDARNVVGDALEAAKPLIQARKHELEIAVSSEALPVLGDPTRLVQILTNLLNNAAKYTPEGGRMRVTAAREGMDVVLRVRDNGAGIAAELLPRVFDLFVQGSQSLDRPQGGLGIGLTLVRQLVHLHGGSVKAHSEGAGKGAEFEVRIPLASNPVPSCALGEPPVQHYAHESHRVLVVDDNRDSADTMATILEHWGYPARSAYEGRSACAIAREWHPQTILLDIGLPGMTGFEVLQSLRAEPQLAGAVVVAMTGYGRENGSEIKAAGFAGHLVKPVDLNKLRKFLESTGEPPG
jgi:PAS domain S-box-containing protein